MSTQNSDLGIIISKNTSFFRFWNFVIDFEHRVVTFQLLNYLMTCVTIIIATNIRSYKNVHRCKNEVYPSQSGS